jgi:hypothetical protein
MTPTPTLGLLVTLAAAICLTADGLGIKINGTAVNARTGNAERIRPAASPDAPRVAPWANTTDAAYDFHGRRRLSTTPVSDLTDDPDRKDITLFIEPEDGAFSPKGR